ncbi:cysteine synthase [Cutibacterium acnes JCM 18916]|nr:cysteine synthase [Cutibacterium acnes JCM 18916]
MAKLEFYNPASSVKDRIATSIVDAAEASGQLNPGGTIVEATSGNTGVGLALVGAARGYKVIITMPETMSKERRAIIRLLGAELVLTPGADGVPGANSKAAEIVENTPGAILASQFDNPANPAIHHDCTGEEIWNDTEGEVDAIVAGIGTGGTISGAGKYLKEKDPEIKIFGAEPAESPVITKGDKAPHKIQAGARALSRITSTSPSLTGSCWFPVMSHRLRPSRCRRRGHYHGYLRWRGPASCRSGSRSSRVCGKDDRRRYR